MIYKPETIAILGAGLVGSLLSILLARRGYKVAVYERGADMRTENIGGGKSINLALSNRGWLPLTRAGVIDTLEDMIIPMKGRMMHDVSGELTFHHYGKEEQAINAISRGGLNSVLMDKAEEEGVEIHFRHQCFDIDLFQNKVRLKHEKGVKSIDADIIIGADGAFSTVRAAIQKTDRFNYSQYYIPHGYKELRIPPDVSGDFLLDKNALHIWPRRSFMLIALPNKDVSFTVTLFLPFHGEVSFENIRSDNDISNLFDEYFPDVLTLLGKSLYDDWVTNPTSSLVTVKCYPWVRNKTMLIGDAAHAIVPFYGQGMNCGFEDCRVFNDILDECDDNWNIALEKYQTQRKPDADAIADLALQNFVEMRDLVADEAFLVRKQIEDRLYDLYPDKWIPQYSMVTFNEQMRYSEAFEKGKKQKAIMDKIMERKAIFRNWELLDFEDIVNQLR